MALNIKSMEAEKLDFAAGHLALDESPESKKLTRRILLKLDTRFAFSRKVDNIEHF
jgi:hypothetical protein